MSPSETPALDEFYKGWNDGWSDNTMTKKSGIYRSAYQAAKKARVEQEWRAENK